MLVARLLAAVLPSFLEATLPMAFLLAIVTALGRMAAERPASELDVATVVDIMTTGTSTRLDEKAGDGDH